MVRVMSAQLRELIDRGPMTRFQWMAVATTIALTIIDGFDVLVVAFTGKFIATEWGLNPGQLGMVLSAGLIGMAVGSLVLAPTADRIGRRRAILICLAVVTVGMLLSSMSQNVVQLGVLRVVTGIGVGGLLANSSVISSEYASKRWRALAVSLITLGYAIGATGGGLLSVLVIPHWGWRSMFVIGGVASIVVIPLVLAALPESMDFLLSRQPKNALQRVRSLAARMQLPIPEELTTIDRDAQSRGLLDGFRVLLRPDLRRATLVLWLAFFLIMAGFYFVMSWTPTLLIEVGLSPTAGLAGGTLLNLGGMLSAAVFGLLAARWAPRAVLIGFLVASAILLMIFVGSLSSLPWAMLVGFVTGVAINGCVAGFYAVTPTIYPPSVRATGVGTVIGIGRAGAIVAPLAAGFLLQSGWSARDLYLACAGVFLVGAAMLLLLRTPVNSSQPETTLSASQTSEATH